jgi:MerR family transcriptional regulator, thiopeptide resistance regulator
MLTIRNLGRQFGLSRATLLYYDRINLLKPVDRSPAGYRLYDETSVAQLNLIRTYRGAGLTLSEIRQLLQTSQNPGRDLLKQRILDLDGKIAEMRHQQRALLALLSDAGDNTGSSVLGKDMWIRILAASGMDDEDMDRWHAAFERNAPRAHNAFLQWLGIPESAVRRIRRKSRNLS